MALARRLQSGLKAQKFRRIMSTGSLAFRLSLTKLEMKQTARQ